MDLGKKLLDQRGHSNAFSAFFPVVRKQADGFTLIEVLVALVILALAFSSALFVLRNSIHQTQQVEIKLFASWIAMNVIAEMQLGLEKPPLGGGIRQGQMQGFHRVWRWRAYLAENSSPYYKRITVVVLQEGQGVVARRDGFVEYSPQ